jgi:SOS-response transcriptional repressor LexA
MDIYARRRARLAMLVEQKTQGNVAEFARTYGYSRSQISQFLSDTYNGGRSIGERAARTLDERLGNPPGWLDLRLSESEKTTLSRPFSTAELRVATNNAQPIDLSPEAPYLHRIQVAARVTANPQGFIESQEHLTDHKVLFLDYYSVNDVYAVQVKGSGLRPRIKNNEYIVIDSYRFGRAGDDVLVTFKDERVAILQVLYLRGDEKAFGTVSDGAPSIIIPESEIEAEELIVGIVGSGTQTFSNQS